MNEDDPQKQADNKPKRDAQGRLLPGSTANPNGRPKGRTIKEQVREWLESHPKDKADFIEHFIKNNRELAWQMLEGRPRQNVGLDGGEDNKPIPLLHVLHNNSNQENPSTQEAD